MTDYSQLAAKYGGTSEIPPNSVDYSQLASKYGGTSEQPTNTPQIPSDYNQSNWYSPESLAANPAVRFATGAAAPILAGLEMIPGSIGENWRAKNEALKQIQQAGQAQQSLPAQIAGGGAEIAGNAMSPVFAPIAKALPIEKGQVLANIGKGAVGGATYGLLTPTGQTDNFAETKGIQAGTGAAAGAVIPPVVSGLSALAKYPYHLVERFLPGGNEQIAGRTLNKAAGDLQPQVIQALQNAAPGETAGQASVAANSPGMAALQETVKGININSAAKYDAIKQAQELARAKELSSTPVEALTKERDIITSPLRQTALDAANTYKEKAVTYSQKIGDKAASIASSLKNRWQMLAEATNQNQLANNWYPVQGMPRISGRYSFNAERVPEYTAAAEDFATVNAQRKTEQALLQYQLDSLEAHGLKPLTSNKIIQSIDSTLSSPEVSVSNKAPILAGIRDKIASATDQNGMINAKSLYTIRKELNETVDSLLASNNQQWSKQRIASLVSDIKPMIDNSIENAAGGGWKNYISTYENLSRKIDQSKILDHLNSTLSSTLDGGSERAIAFANAVKNAPQTLEKVTGFGGYDKIQQVLTPEQMNSVNSVMSDLNKQSRYKELAKAGQQAITKQLGDTSHEIKPIGLLERSVVIANAILRRIQGGAGEKSLNELSTYMQDPQKTAQLMMNATEKEKNALKIIQGYAIRAGTTEAAKQGTK